MAGVDPSTGAGHASIGFQLLRARGQGQPSLAVSYNSANGSSTELGYAWSLNLPRIERENRGGGPLYNDEDRFRVNGAELIPICQVVGEQCFGGGPLLPGEKLPNDVTGWKYFRTAIDDSTRYFLSPDRRTWRADSKSGVQAEYGAPRDDGDNFTGLDIGRRDADGKPIAFRWNLVRLWGNGRANVVVYRWEKFEGEKRGYLVDILDTPGANATVSSPAEIPLGQFAHHARLTYSFIAPTQGEIFPDAALWHARPAYHLARVDVTSANFNAIENGRRHLVRRYTLDYWPSRSHRLTVRSMLKRVDLNGACPDILEDDKFAIPDAICNSEHRTIAEMTYTAPIDVEREPTPSVRDFPHDFYGEESRLTFVDLDNDGDADGISLPPRNFPSEEPKGPILVGIASSTQGGFVVGQMDLQNAQLGARPYNVFWLNGNVFGGWGNDGKVNQIWWDTPQSTGRYMTYAPQRKGTTADWSWVGSAVHELSNSAWPKMTGPRKLVDLDGDGYTDSQNVQLYIPEPSHPPKPKRYRTCEFFSSRDPSGNVLPYSRGPSEAECTATKDDDEYRPEDAETFYVDFSGDGIPDKLTMTWVKGANDPAGPLQDQEWKVHYGLGTGTFTAGTVIAGGVKATHPWHIAATYLHDLNGDGIVERIDLRNTSYETDFGDGIRDPNPGIDIAFGDGTKWDPPIHLSPDSGPPYRRLRPWGRMYRVPDGDGYGTWHQPMHLQFVPTRNNEGYDTILTTVATPDLYRIVGYIDVLYGARPGLLSSITNGVGAKTRLVYGTVKGVPGAHSCVTSRVVESNADERITGGSYLTKYVYSEPVYDYLEHQFRGFRKVRTTDNAWLGPNPVTTESRYLIGACVDSSGGDIPCAPAVDNPRTAIRGLPLTVDTFDTNGVHRSTSHQRYRMDKLYDGLDGRKVRRVYAAVTDNWIYDTASFAPSPVNLDVVDLQSDEVTLNGSYSVATAKGTAHTGTSRELDLFGNVTSGTAYGRLDRLSPDMPVDSPIVSATDWTLPAGDSTNWLWRPSDSYVRESLAGPNLRHAHYEYDATGNLRKTFGDLSGTLPLMRSHEDRGAEVAPTPADASHDGANLLRSEMSYDAFGNLRRVRNATGIRCADMSYDAAYAQLPVSQTAYKHGCGGAGLTTIAVYDRGLEVPTEITDPTGAKSTTLYDGWGRPKEIYKPNPALGVLAESAPSAKVTYFDVPGGPYQRVQVEARDDDGSLARYRTSWSYMDPYGHTVATIRQADAAAGDLAPYIVSGQVERDERGRVVKAYQPYFATVDPQSPTPPAVPANVASSSVAYDAFGQILQTFGLEGEPKGKALYHALWQETFDAADLAPGVTPHPTKTVWDGHGRITLKQRATNAVGAAADTISTQMAYLPTGELNTVTRTHSAGSDVYTRTMQYDSWGRLVQNAEPNTSSGFGTAKMKAWRYAYNDSGDVVGTSDARGCGKNTEWDGLGRPLSETYSPCMRSHAEYRDRATNLFVYDAPEQGQEGNAQFFVGRLAASYDRAQRTRYAYDGRGRVTRIARQIAFADQNGIPFEGAADIGAGEAEDEAAMAAGYASHWYKTAIGYDQADRVIARSMGMEVPEMQGESVTVGDLTGKDLVTTSYTVRGIANRVGGSYGDLTTRKIVDADGLVRFVTYGDTAGTEASYFYDTRRRLQRSLIQRAAPEIWRTPPVGYTVPSPSVTAQTVLQDLTVDSYDAVDNPLKVSDARIAAEWPAGAKPVATKQFSYDDLYQLRRVDYQTGEDVQVSPFADEAENDDTRPIPEPKIAKRVKWQSFDFDWQGNLTKSDDDVHAFHDRSMGTMVYGTPTNGPNRVVAANAEKGHAKALYDASGNLTGLTLTKPGPDEDVIDLTFSYEWDEVGRLVRAKRKPLSGVATGVEFRYTYTSGGARVIKSVEDPRSHERVYSVEVFPTLRLNGARFRSREYELNEDTAAAYLVSNGATLARVVHGDPGLPTIGDRKARVYFMMSDPLGSTSTVVDKSTSELVERSTYLAFGQAETDYRPKRWQYFREDYRFTGKEDDVGVGLTYFGYRYYVAALGQWASADPLTVHGLGSDLNPYAYAMGSPQRHVDPLGLLTPQEQTVTNAGVMGDSYSAGSIIPWTDGSGGGCLPLLTGGFSCAEEEVTVGGGKQPGISEYQSPAESARAWGKWIFQVERYAAQQAAEPHGWGDSAKIVGKGAWNSVVSMAAGALQISAVGTYASGVVDAGQEALSFAEPTTPSATADYQAGYYGVAVGAAMVSAVLAIREVAAGAVDLIGMETAACFTAGTLVTTCDGGQQPIETIRRGDTVASWNEKTGAIECRPVAQTSVRASNELVDLELSGADGHEHVVHTTLEHPFWVNGKGWTRSGDLLPGDETRSRDGAPVTVNAASRQDGSTWVYNFEVEENHSYFVGNAQVLVHNTCAVPLAKDVASTPQSAIALSKQLAAEAQAGEAGQVIAGAGGQARFRDAARIAQTYGGSRADWVKMTSSSFKAADGTKFSTHWVQNLATGQRAEPKVVIDVFGGP